MKVLEKAPDVAIFGGFVLATAIFAATTFAWAARPKYRTQLALSCFSLGTWMVFWLVMGVNVEEFIFICLPLGISFGILASGLCEE